ncbi:hypothetical protein AMECASPLE_030050 [Ameca splendens]|uniref:Uncharacterized protein n=1 Tax=Ameca splendens TaxID=208324 RepID=A0ABV0YU92_9TELE
MLVTVGALAAYAVINKHKQTKNKDMKQKLVNEWLDDDFQWSRPTIPSGTHGASKFLILCKHTMGLIFKRCTCRKTHANVIAYAKLIYKPDANQIVCVKFAGQRVQNL